MTLQTYSWQKEEVQMQTVGAALVKGVDVEEVVERLDSFYCYNMVVLQFCLAMENRLEGQASFLLGDELEEVAEEALECSEETLGEDRGAWRRDHRRPFALGREVTASRLRRRATRKSV